MTKWYLVIFNDASGRPRAWGASVDAAAAGAEARAQLEDARVRAARRGTALGECAMRVEVVNR